MGGFNDTDALGRRHAEDGKGAVVERTGSWRESETQGAQV